MLSQHGELGRVYLVPEDPLARKRRKQAGRNSGKNFTEGWVEFEDKRVAKQVPADLLVHPVSLFCPAVPWVSRALYSCAVICNVTLHVAHGSAEGCSASAQTGRSKTVWC